MSDTNGYNGWSNRSTWAAKLNLDNEEVLYLDCEKLARRAAAGNEDDLESFHYELAEALEEYFGYLLEYYPESLPDFDPNTHESPDPKDNHGPDDPAEVNWMEIAESYDISEYI